ncbi:MAG: hypothetical protein QOI63_151 [Thermoplasmata archaeon]|jgi:uncharacterized membrane protein|nr:hypothetical protein [Thermoplasmata archaeon]
MARAFLAAALVLALLAVAAPAATASPPYTDCDHGVTVRGQFYGYCGQAPDCMAIVVADREQAKVGCH